MKNFFVKFITSITPLVLSCFGLLGISPSHATSTKILAFGDSLTAGYRLKPEQAFPAQLAKMLKEKGLNVEVINGGVSGETSAQGLKRLEWNLKRGGPFKVVLLGLGANDGLRQQPVKLLERNLEEAIRRFQGSGAKVVLLGMKLPPNFNPIYRRDFEAVYPRLAKKTGALLVPFLLEGVAAQSDLNLDDQIHPNAEGHAIIAKNLLNYLVPLL